MLAKLVLADEHEAKGYAVLVLKSSLAELK